MWPMGAALAVSGKSLEGNQNQAFFFGILYNFFMAKGKLASNWLNL